MILYAAEGLSNDEIAARLDTRREVVSLWRERFCADRRTGRARSSGASADFFPQISSFKLRRWPVNYQPNTVCPSRAGGPWIWSGKSNRVVWLPQSAGVRCGTGCTKICSGRGITAVGCSLRISLSGRTRAGLTNMLSLNAACRGGARGEAGLGFSVVAKEVQSLA
jgi:hypothetical protein